MLVCCKAEKTRQRSSLALGRAELDARVCALPQRVQLQLKAGEFTDKADASPVTIADYGTLCGALSPGQLDARARKSPTQPARHATRGCAARQARRRS